MISDYADFEGETVVMKFSRLLSMPSASLSMLLYLVSMLDMCLLVNTVGHITLSPGTPSCREFMSSISCSSYVPLPTTDVSVSKFHSPLSL